MKVWAFGDTRRGYMKTLKTIKSRGWVTLTYTTRSRSRRPETRANSLILFDKAYGYIKRTGIISELDKGL